jgi:hypothetical protein
MESNGQSIAENTSNQNKIYFLLSDCLTEDKILRDEIHHAKLVRNKYHKIMILLIINTI